MKRGERRRQKEHPDSAGTWARVFRDRWPLLYLPEGPDVGQGDDLGGGVLANTGGTFCSFLGFE